MNGILALVAASVVAIDVGWQPLPDGGFEYIIQLEPQTLESLKDGQDLSSQLPPALQGIRTYRITVGNGPLPHEGEPPPVTASPSAVAKVPANGSPPPSTFQIPIPPGETPVGPPPSYNPPSYPPPAYNSPAGSSPPNAAPPNNPPPYTPPGNFATGPASSGASQPGFSTGAAPAGSGSPGTLPNLPPPPADNTVPPIDTDPERPAPTSSSPYDPPSTTRPSLETDPRGAAPNAPTYLGNPPPAGQEVAPNSSNVDFSYPGASPSIRKPPRAEPPADVRLNAPPPAETRSSTTGENSAIGTGASAPNGRGERPAKGNSDEGKAAKGKGDEPPPNESGTKAEPKPWLPLVGSMLALFASLGGNLYLGMNTLSLRNQYRSLLTQLHAG
jgi:hypothetical protein